MAKAHLNTFDGFIGKIGDTVTYILNGVVVRRKIGRTKKPATLSQLAARQTTPLSNDFIKPVKEFINIGFKAEGKSVKRSANSMISSYTRLNAIKGTYPNQEIDFTKVRFSQGNMPLTPQTKVILIEDGLQFSWDKTLIPGQFRADDQVMLVVYFPGQKTAEHTVNGGARSNGIADFPLVRQENPVIIETYISFISADREKVSNTFYTGQLILPAFNPNP